MLVFLDKGYITIVLKMFKLLKKGINKDRKVMYEQNYNINRDRDYKMEPRRNYSTESILIETKNTQEGFKT